MRIALTGQTYYPGNNGQAIFTIHLAEGLARAGHDVAVLVPGWNLQYRYEIVNGVFIHQVRTLNFRWIHPEARYSFLPQEQIAQIFRSFRPQVVHLQDHYFLSRDVVRIARRMKIPVLGTNHFLPENLLPYLHLLPIPKKFKISILWDLMLSTYNQLSLVTTPTETAARILRSQQIRIPVFPISCGVDTCTFHPSEILDRREACHGFGLNPDKALFLYVGRLDREKNINLLLRGLGMLVRSGCNDIQLAIAGQGAAGGELRGLARSLGLEEHVRFLGYVLNDRLALLYQTAHIFAMPSPEELQSIASLEAMACGRPVLAANARALPELVTTGLNGYLFDSGKVESVAAGMTYLLKHRNEWDRMGQVSRARAETHSLHNTIRKYEAIYEHLIGLPQKPVREPASIFMNPVEMK